MVVKHNSFFANLVKFCHKSEGVKLAERVKV